MSDLWFNFKRKTFDTWAHKLGVGDAVKSSYAIDYIMGWQDREAEYKKKKFWYFLLVSVPDFIDDILDTPKRIGSFYRTCKRFLFERHDLVRTKLSRGGYHDTDSRLEAAIISLLIDFVEKELPDAQGEDLSNYENPGLACLEEKISNILENIDDYKPADGKQRVQRLINIKEAYLYFKFERPIDVTVMDQEWDELTKDGWATLSKQKRSKALKKIAKMEEAIHKADTRHFTNIIYAREHLWS